MVLNALSITNGPVCVVVIYVAPIARISTQERAVVRLNLKANQSRKGRTRSGVERIIISWKSSTVDIVNKHEIIKNKISIDDRPEVINSKKRFGDWEIDLIVGKNNKGAMVTLVERTTAMIMIRKLENGKNADSLANVVIDMLLPYKETVKSITSDNGSEFARHEKIAQKLFADFYFAHPYSSWERGLSEYSNKLIRQYIPKKSNFDKMSF